MSYFKIYHSGHELNVVHNQPIDNIMKISSHSDHVFVLTTSKQLFFGTLNGTGPQAQIQFELIRNDVIDVACCIDSVYVVDENGSIQHCPLMAFDFDKRWNDIPILNYGAIYEGIIANGGNVVRVLEVCCNNDGVLFITVDRELYAMGNFNDVCTSDQPIKVAQFINYEILQVSMGKHFAVILTRKRTSQPYYATVSHTNHIDSSSCDDSMSSIDNSLAGISMIENDGESLASATTPLPCDSSKHCDSNSLNSINVSQLNTITNNNHTDTEISSPEHSLQFDVEHAIGRLMKTNGMIQTQVWCFGSINGAGQLGVGDHVKRMHAVEVISLRNQGVIQICSGDEHTAALTLDARLYLWGDNSNEQISHWLEKEDCSSPKRFYETEKNIFGVQCGQHSTFILTNNLDRYELSRNKHFASIAIQQEFNEDYSLHQSDHLFLASRQYLIVGTVYRPLQFEKYLKFEQQFLQDILRTTRPNIEQFLRILNRNIQIKHPQLYRQFAQQYINITELAAKNIASLIKFACYKCDFMAIAFIQHYTEYVHVYHEYCKLYCETLCSDDFSRVSQMIIQNADFTSKFSIPLQHTSNYIDYLCELLEIHPNNDTLQTALKHWQQFLNQVDEMLNLANSTINFWTANQKTIPTTLQIPERRFIMDSKEYSLKLLPSSRFKSNWFLLFNDIFCHSTGSSSSLKQYPLKTLWVCNVIDKDLSPSGSSSSSTATARKYAFKIITPEEEFLVSASSNDVKMKWLNSFELYIKMALGRVNSKSNFMRRTTTYTFSDKHRVYPLCRYLGQWYFGKMDGIGCIEYTDGRIYTGQIKANVINGYGRLTYSNSDCYEGRFLDGRFDGFGTLETHQTNENYEGHFKNGFKHGFGILIDNMRTYIGEFINGIYGGYGVLDDAENGEKYMGIFKDGHRFGYGFCITADSGKYFEGNFVDNELNGNGIAMFTDGSYYEGELNISGPNGRGSLYLPTEPLYSEMNIEINSEKVIVRGNILTGNSLSGCWENIKINNGSIALNQEFSKYPNQIGHSKIENQSKWSALFMNWEFDVFGTSMDEINDMKKLWIKISEYMDTVKQIEVLKSTISTSAVLYKSGGNVGGQANKIYSDTSHTNHFLHDPTTSNSCHVSKSLSLSRITGKNYKRNLLAVERAKSISNEFLNIAVNFSHTNDTLKSDTNDMKTSNGNNDIFDLSLAFKSPIPCFGITKLDTNDLRLVRDYLTKALKNQYHPLGILNAKISYCFYTSYGCWKVKPIAIVSTHAMHEWESISRRIYNIVRKLFPTLPQEYSVLDDEFISHRSLLYPILLSEGVYSTLFVLYANKCSKRDEIYRQRIQLSDKKTDDELMIFLKLSSKYRSLIKDGEFSQAIFTLQQVKEKFCPREMLQLIEKTFKHVEAAAEMTTKLMENASEAQQLSESEDNRKIDTEIVQLNADNMMPLTIFLLLRAAIPHLGTEILLLEDLMGPDFEFVMNGFAGYCFTTIKAAYQHIINDTFLH